MAIDKLSDVILEIHEFYFYLTDKNAIFMCQLDSAEC